MAMASVESPNINNRDPKPFIWHKTADQILDSVARFCKRINHLDGISVSDLATGIKVAVWFQDSLNKEYSVVQTASVATISGPNAWPGMRVPTSPIRPDTRR
jgi:hypothetical protein